MARASNVRSNIVVKGPVRFYRLSLRVFRLLLWSKSPLCPVFLTVLLMLLIGIGKAFTDEPPLSREQLLEFEGAAIEVPIQELLHGTPIHIERLQDQDLPPLDQGMINVTAEGGGYRFLPVNKRFDSPVRIFIPLDNSFFTDKAAQLVGTRTYYWDEDDRCWVPLPKAGIDTTKKRLVSTTTHFTTMINAILTAPDHPPPLQFNPNSIKDIAAVEPTAGIELIEPPTANNRGTTELSYPIRLPKGRGAFSPELVLSYSSARGNGWLGMGWDLPLSQVEVDTRWGVPTYKDESERYLLNGAAIVPIPKDPRATCQAKTNSTVHQQFAPRKETFERILLCQNATTQETHWEVTGKDGTRFEYGSDVNSRLTSYRDDEKTHTAVWFLRRVVDANGNVTIYNYDEDTNKNIPNFQGEPFVQKYLKEIIYTSHENNVIPAAYRVELKYYKGSPSDPPEIPSNIIVSGRTGFKVLTRYLLSQIEIFFTATSQPSGQLIRRYLFDYKEGSASSEYGGAFGKTVLSKIQVQGSDGSDFYHHSFNYTTAEVDQSSDNIFSKETSVWEISPQTTPDTIDIYPLNKRDRLLNHTSEESHSVGAGVGVGIDLPGVYCTAGVNGKGTWENPNPEILLLDINGDNLADRVWLQDGQVKALLGKQDSQEFSIPYPETGTTPYRVKGITHIGTEDAKGEMMGVSASCTTQTGQVSAGLSFSVREVDANSLLTDVDGDGHVDLALGGSFYRGLPRQCRDGSLPDPTTGKCPDGMSACPDSAYLCFEFDQSLSEIADLRSPQPPTDDPDENHIQIASLQEETSAIPGVRMPGSELNESPSNVHSLLASLPASRQAANSASSPSTPTSSLDSTSQKSSDWDRFTAKRLRLEKEPHLKAEMYRLNPVIRWDARHDGTINLEALARRKYFGGKDGVEVSILHVTNPTISAGTKILGAVHLLPDDHDWRNIPGSGKLDVKFEESLLFIVDTVDDVPVDGAGNLVDEVELEIEIKYTRVCPPKQPCRDLAPQDLTHVDATGQLAYSYHFPSDLRISELPRDLYWRLLPPLGLPRKNEDGSVDLNRVVGTVRKVAKTQTPVHVRIRCESMNSQDANDNTICPLGTVLFEQTFAPEELDEASLDVALPSPWVEKLSPLTPESPVAVVSKRLSPGAVEELNKKDITIGVPTESIERLVKEAFPEATIKRLFTTNNVLYPEFYLSSLFYNSFIDVYIARYENVSSLFSENKHPGPFPFEFPYQNTFLRVREVAYLWPTVNQPLAIMQGRHTYLYEPIRLLFEIDGENGAEIPPEAVEWNPSIEIVSLYDMEEVRKPISKIPVVLVSKNRELGKKALTSEDLNQSGAEITVQNQNPSSYTLSDIFKFAQQRFPKANFSSPHPGNPLERMLEKDVGYLGVQVARLVSGQYDALVAEYGDLQETIAKLENYSPYPIDATKHTFFLGVDGLPKSLYGIRALVRDDLVGNNSAKPLRLYDYDDLNRPDITIAFASGSYAEMTVEHWKDVVKKDFPSVQNALDAVMKGDADALIADMKFLETAIAKPEIASKAFLGFRRGKLHDINTEVAYIRRTDPIFFEPEETLHEHPRVLYRVHPARQLIPFLSSDDHQKLKVTVEGVNLRKPLIISVTGEQIEGEVARWVLHPEDIKWIHYPTGNKVFFQSYVTELPKAGLYYVRGYSEAGFDKTTRISLKAELLQVRSLPQLALVHKEFGQNVRSYTDLNKPGINIGVEKGSTAEHVVRKHFSSAILSVQNTKEEVLAMLLGGDAVAMIADADFIQSQISDPRVSDIAFQCCPPDGANAFTVFQNITGPTNLLTAKFGGGHRGQHLTVDARDKMRVFEQEVIGEIPHAQDPWGGGHHGFFYGEIRGDVDLTCIGSVYCDDTYPSYPSTASTSPNPFVQDPSLLSHTAMLEGETSLISDASPLVSRPPSNEVKIRNRGEGRRRLYPERRFEDREDDKIFDEDDPDQFPPGNDDEPPEPIPDPNPDPDKDSDGDGVIDLQDPCPFAAGEPGGNGCPSGNKTGRKVPLCQEKDTIDLSQNGCLWKYLTGFYPMDGAKIGSKQVFTGSDPTSRVSEDGVHSTDNNSLSSSGDGTVDGALRRSQNFGLSVDAGAYVSGGVSFGVNANIGVGSTYGDLEYMDWNGDGLPDIVSPNTIILTGRAEDEINLGLTCQLFDPFDPEPDPQKRRCLVYPGIHESRNSTMGLAMSLGPAANFQHKTTPGGGVKELSWSKIEGGIGIHSQTSMSVKRTDRFDINGDGLPDLIMGKNDAGSNKLIVRLNLGYRLGEEEDWGDIGNWGLETTGELGDQFKKALKSIAFHDALSRTDNITVGTSVGASGGFGALLFGGGGSFGRSDDLTIAQTSATIADINGDGLPDLVTKNPGADNMLVQFNRGGKAGQANPVFTETLAYKVPVWKSNPGIDSREILPVRFLKGITNLTGAARWLLPAMQEAPDGLVVSGGDTGTYSGTAHATVFGVRVSTSYHYTSGHSFVQMALIDVTGDGLPDRVLRSGSEKEAAAVQVQKNRLGGANLLTTIHRPLGGRIVLNYTQTIPSESDPNTRWVLSDVVLEHEDTFPAENRTSKITETFEYEDPYHDRFEREFFGFKQVKTTRGDGRVELTTYANRDYRLQGLVLKNEIFDKNHNPFTSIENQYQLERLHIDGSQSERQACLKGLRFPLKRLADQTLSDPMNTPNTPCDVWFAKPTKTTTSWFEGGTSSKKQTAQHFEAYDKFGNLTRIRDEQNEDPADGLVAVIAYDHQSTDGSPLNAHQEALLNAHIVDCVESIDVRQQSLTGKQLRFRRGTYDDKGNLTKHEVFADSAGQKIATLDFGYDATGFMTWVKDTSDYKVDYTPEKLLHMFAEKTEDSFGLTSSAQYDYQFQLPTVQVDANGQKQITHYDIFGRLQKVQGPYELAANQDSLAIDYSLPSDPALPAFAISTNTAVHPETNKIHTKIRAATYIDGLGRELQTQVDAEVQTQSATIPELGRIVSGKVEFDEGGRRIKEGHPVFRKGSDFQPEKLSLATTPLTEWFYDALDRVIKTIEPGNRVTTSEYTVSTHPRVSSIKTLSTKITDPEGKVRIEHRDAQERLLAVVLALNGTDLITSYSYQPTGELEEIKDARDNITALEYDIAGRRTAVTTPDTGRLELGYDVNGNLIEKTDQVLCPNQTTNLLANCGNKKIRYIYPKYSRLKSIAYPNLENVTYSYGDEPGQCPGDNNAKGRICKVVDGTGTEERSYGALGELTRTERQTNGAPWENFERTFITKFVYDSFGRLLSLVYPDGETLTYSYDKGGQVTSVTGKKGTSELIYVKDVWYDEFGQRIRLEYGNGVVTTYQYEPDTRRLDTKIITPNAGAPYRTVDYDYDKADNITDIQDIRAGAMPPFLVQANRSYTYDDLHHLKTFKITTTPSAPASAVPIITLGSFDYDEVGNITRQLVKRQQGGQSLTQYPARDWTYDYSDPQYPPNLPAIIGPYTYTYDARGSIKSVTRDPDDAPVGATYEWDDEGRLLLSYLESDPLRKTRYWYDAEDQRVRKQTPHELTEPASDAADASVYPNVYYSARFARYPAADCNGDPCWDAVVSRSKHVFIDTERIATTAMVIPQQATTASVPTAEDKLVVSNSVRHFFHSDPVSSVTLLTDANGKRGQEIEYLPFGEVLAEKHAPSDAGQPQAFRFDGKELDPETGLQYFGARYYDSKIGRWISGDPLYRMSPDVGLETPQDLNLFTFVSNRPVVYSDADGLQFGAGSGRLLIFYRRDVPITGRRGKDALRAYYRRINMKGIQAIDAYNSRLEQLVTILTSLMGITSDLSTLTGTYRMLSPAMAANRTVRPFIGSTRRSSHRVPRTSVFSGKTTAEGGTTNCVQCMASLLDAIANKGFVKTGALYPPLANAGRISRVLEYLTEQVGVTFGRRFLGKLPVKGDFAVFTRLPELRRGNYGVASHILFARSRAGKVYFYDPQIGRRVVVKGSYVAYQILYD